jgi:hypothetical protein
MTHNASRPPLHHRSIAALLAFMLLVVPFAALAPAPSAYAASGQLSLGPSGQIVLDLPSGGKASFALQNAFPGASFVTIRVDWLATDTRTHQIRFDGVPGAPILGFDLNSSIFQPQPRDSDQIILNVQPPQRAFAGTFIFELAGQLNANTLIDQIAVVDLSNGAQTAVSNVPVLFDPAATSGVVDLTGGSTLTGGIKLLAGGELKGGDGASVTGAVTTQPGSRVEAARNVFTLGDGSAPVKLGGEVAVQPGATLDIKSSTKAELGGQVEVTNGTIASPSGILLGTADTEQAMVDALAQMRAAGVAERAAAREARAQERAAQLKQLQNQANALRTSATLALLKGVLSGAFTIASPAITLGGASKASIRSTLVGDVIVAGTLQIGGPRELGHTDLQGDLTVGSGSQLAIESIGTGAGQTDHLTISGDATFDTGAILVFDLLDPADPANGANPFTPQLYDEFDILTAASITSGGIAVNAPPLTDRAFVAGIHDTPDGRQTLRLTVVPYIDLPADNDVPLAAPSQNPAANPAGWNTGAVTVNWNWSDAGVGIDAEFCTTSSSAAGEGEQALNATCSDYAENQGSAAYSVKVDSVAPSLAPLVSPNPVPANGSATVVPNAADATSGVASITCGALDLATPGTKSVSCTATDNAGNTTTASAGYTVLPAANSLLDDFNRANGPVGANWDGLTGQGFYRIAGNKLDVQLGGPLVWKSSSFGTSQEVAITLSAIDSRSPSQGVLLKVQSTGGTDGGAIAVVYDAVSRRVRVSTLRLNQKTWTIYSGVAATFANGDRLAGLVRASGEVEISKNGTLLTTVTLTAADQTFFNGKGGRIGVWSVAAPNALFDDFGGGTLAP